MVGCRKIELFYSAFEIYCKCEDKSMPPKVNLFYFEEIESVSDKLLQTGKQ